MSKNIVFIDQIGRTIFGELTDVAAETITVKNPAMINVNQLQNGQLQVQIFPLFFREFIEESEREKGTTWAFNKSQITTTSDTVVDSKLVEQYNRVVGNIAAVTPTAGPATIKLFDE